MTDNRDAVINMYPTRPRKSVYAEENRGVLAG